MRIVRKLVDLSQGLNGTPLPSINGSNDVIIEGMGVVRVSDDYGQTHGHPSHSMGQAIQGSPNVFANGLAIHRVDDSIFCGDRGGTGSLTVFCN